MFWFWAFASMFGYALQNVLMARHIRKIEVLSAGFYRNASFAVSFLPALWFVAPDAWSNIIPFLPQIIVASLLGAGSQWTRFKTIRYLPIGVSSSGIMGFNVFLSWLFGWLYFSEVLTLPVLACLFTILIGSITLAVTRQTLPHLEGASVAKGAGLILLTSLFISSAFVLVAKVSRELDPFLTAYLWEVGIAIAALGLIIVRGAWGGGRLEKIKLQTFHQIFWCVSPTVLGTVGFALAVNLGPLAIVAAISATGVLVVTWLGVLMYKEVLRPIHYGAMLLTVLSVVGLHLLS